MIHPSLFLRRALLADAIFSGVSAVGLTLGAGIFASLLDLPKALLRESGLFLIAYAIFVAWLGTRASMPKLLVAIVVAGNAAWTLASIALSVDSSAFPFSCVPLMSMVIAGFFVRFAYQPVFLPMNGRRSTLLSSCTNCTGSVMLLPVLRPMTVIFAMFAVRMASNFSR